MTLYKLLTPKAFAELLSKETKRRIIPVDSTWYLPNLNRSGKQEFLDEERLKGAVYFDIDGVKDMKSEYPHMLPDLSTFNKSMSELGLKKDDILVVYDRIGNFSAPRCAWTLAVLGHDPVYLLNNFPALKLSGYPVETSKVTSFTPYEMSEYVSDVDLAEKETVSFEDMQKLVSTGDIKNYQVLDARSLQRFTGEAPEPRPGLSSGHIPGVQPLPFLEVLNSDKTFTSDREEMLKKIQDFVSQTGNEFETDKPTIAMCGTGVTGVIIKTALEISGVKNVRLYDGSWTEWVMKDGEVAKGS
ncbi:thiosulfate sulfurtransferase [Kluyveromyces lactis]|uniref:Sulfurtransferase n=1 Tax=Kluyveromyces lactis (strain ATCC 8585 / CBS 2359 / DSM 70799 / NBRC 1267 / NRRL Y-1140 / WM37) TaxID=284590 RepID=Q6CTU6_KLULA|nr:uncharacterized protein KLLA0_C09966g [Kluyveromyces lactis]CAH01494.1 KLLA0C09966p [Kluyveromyces lactis]|eukprot:XP_452643.1 uncharacterized protein KLLA0_C09966g [Kluyveromyces lactis]